MKKKFSKKSSLAIKSSADELKWIEILKGIAIIGVVFDHLVPLMILKPTPVFLSNLVYFFPWGAVVHIFFFLSGFGLTMGYVNMNTGWSWRKWSWRRITKIVIPYEISIIVTFAVGLFGSYLYTSVDNQLTWGTFLAYITFGRNFYQPAWYLNQALWFMPNIICLYIIFPLLINIINRWGMWILLLISIFITYGTISMAVFTGNIKGHQGDPFSFYILQFTIGMVVAYARAVDRFKLSSLIGFKTFLIGIGVLFISFTLKMNFRYGFAYNDVFTTIGFFLTLINIGCVLRLYAPVIARLLNRLGSESYLIFLVHYPIMSFLIIPPQMRGPINPIIAILFGGLFIIGIFYLCRFLSHSINKLSSWVFCLFYPTYIRHTNSN